MSHLVRIGTAAATPSFTGTAGVARRDITPPAGIRTRNWGPAETDAAEGIHRSLTLTAVALSGEGRLPLVLLCVDGTWWRRVDDEWRVRSAILERLDVSPDRLLLALSHTHAGPVLCSADADLPGGDLIPGYLDALVEAAVSAGGEALSGLQPATMQWTTGRCSLAAERELDLGGEPVVGFNPGIAGDDTVIVGRLADVAGDIMACLVNYACHPTTLGWQNRLLSPDYVGAMRHLVEDQTGAPCGFVQGASGELAPRQQYVGDVEVADRHGMALGHAVLAALNTLPPAGTALTLTGVVESGAPLGIWEPRPCEGSSILRSRQESVELLLQELPSLDDLRLEWTGIDERSLDERLRRARNLRDGYVTGPTVHHPLWAWQIGDALLIAHPGEAYSPLQTRLRSRFPNRPVIVMNLTNGPGFVYLPTEDAYRRRAYQAWQTAVAAGSLERVERHAVELLDRLLRETT